MSTPINREVWALFALASENILDQGFTARHLEVRAYPHPYKELTRIHVTVKEPAVRSNGKPGVAKRALMIDGKPTYVYTVYNRFVEMVQKRLADIGPFLDKSADPDAFNEVYGVMVDLYKTAYFDEKGEVYDPNKRKLPEGLESGYPFMVTRMDVYCEETNRNFCGSEQFAEFWDFLMDKGFIRTENKFNKIAKGMADHIKNIGMYFRNWALETKIEKTYDLYGTIDINPDTLDVKFCLDKLAAITPDDKKTADIARTPIALTDWVSQDIIDAEGKIEGEEKLQVDYRYLSAIERQTIEINKVVQRLKNEFANATGWELSMYKEMLAGAIIGPVVQFIHIVWTFSDVCETGRTMVDQEVSKILETIDAKRKETELEIFMDMGNMLMFTRDEKGDGHQLDDAEQVIRGMFRHYTGAFSKAVQTGLINSSSGFLRPMTTTTPAIIDEVDGAAPVPVIDQEALLAKENEIRH